MHLKNKCILSSIQSPNTEHKIEYGCYNKNNAYIYIAKRKSADYASLTHKEDICIWPSSRKWKSMGLKFPGLHILVDNLLYKATVFIQGKL